MDVNVEGMVGINVEGTFDDSVGDSVAVVDLDVY